MRLLIECTYVYEHPKINSGIQRVVRNIVRELDNSADVSDCIPVILKNKQVHQVLHFEPTWQKSLLFAARHYLQAIHHRFWLLYEKLSERQPLRTSRNLRRARYVIARLISLPVLIPLLAVKFFMNWWMDGTYTQRIDCNADDVLVLLDSSWQPDSFAIAERLKARGVHIVSVVYDLIPISHPQFFNNNLSRVFQHWFEWAAHNADGFLAISQAVCEQTRREVHSRAAERDTAQRTAQWFDFFYLGSELDLADASHAIDPQVVAAFADNLPVYLMVSTIEPRKNHSYLLDAFDRLWSQGSAAKLCFIGKVGWKCEELIKRIKTHPEFGRRLLMFNNISDTELEYCYEHAKALTFSSHAEGFGLPLVEAMQRGLPAMASDIPVFREIGGDFTAYFDLADPASLAALVAAFERTGTFPAARDVADWQWLSWSEAALMLVKKIRLHSEQIAINSLPRNMDKPSPASMPQL